MNSFLCVVLDRACIHHLAGHLHLGLLVLVTLLAELPGPEQVDRSQDRGHEPRGEEGAARSRASGGDVHVLLAPGRRFAHQGGRTASGGWGGSTRSRRRWSYWGQRAILEGAQLREELRSSSWPCRSHPAFLVRIDTWERKENN